MERGELFVIRIDVLVMVGGAVRWSYLEPMTITTARGISTSTFLTSDNSTEVGAKVNSSGKMYNTSVNIYNISAINKTLNSISGSTAGSDSETRELRISLYNELRTTYIVPA